MRETRKSAGLALRILVSLNSRMMMTSRVLPVRRFGLVCGRRLFDSLTETKPQATRSDVLGASNVPAMYPEGPDGHGRVRTVPVENAARNAVFCEGYGASANRTTDTVIFSHVLYQLSYLGAAPTGGGGSPGYKGRRGVQQAEHKQGFGAAEAPNRPENHAPGSSLPAGTVSPSSSSSCLPGTT